MITHNRPCLISFLYSSNFYILCRMISTHNSLHSVSDIILILISRFQKSFQLFQKLSHIKRNRASNMNQIILRLLQPFLRHQLLFIQLLTRPQPVYVNLISTSGLYPDSLIRFLASVSIFTGSPISSTKISPPFA